MQVCFSDAGSFHVNCIYIAWNIVEFSVVSLKTVKTNNAHHFSQAQEKNSSLNIFQASSIIFCGYSQLVLQRDATFRDSYPAETNFVHQSV